MFFRWYVAQRSVCTCGCAAVDHAWSLVSHCPGPSVPVIELPRHPADFRSAAPACHAACLAEPLWLAGGGRWLEEHADAMSVRAATRPAPTLRERLDAQVAYRAGMT